MLPSFFIFLLIAVSTIAGLDVLTKEINSRCPEGGIWSEWETIGSCATTCGSCNVATRKRTCMTLCGDCPCDGPSEDVGPCGIALCQFPKKTCCGLYTKSLNERTNDYFCSLSGVDIIPAPQCARPTCNLVSLPDATSKCDETFSGRCSAATYNDTTFSCPTGQLFLSSPKTPAYSCDQCQATCSNSEWTLSQGGLKLAINRAVGDNATVACINPAAPPACGFLPDAIASCNSFIGTSSGRECYAATYSSNTYWCPGGHIFFTGSKIEEFATCAETRCAFTCYNNRWIDGRSNDWGDNLNLACIPFPSTTTCSPLRDGTVTCNLFLSGRCSAATYSNMTYSCPTLRNLFVSGSRSLVSNVDGLRCSNGVWTVTQGGNDVTTDDFVGARPIVSCVN